MDKKLKLYVAPYLIWMSLFFVIPTFLVILVSFVDNQSWNDILITIRDFSSTLKSQGLQKATQTFFDLDLKFSLAAYFELGEPRVVVTILRTITIAFITSIICVLISLPSAHFISRSKQKDFWLLLLILPFWVNFLIRIFSWIKILGNNGLLNSALLSMGIIQKPLSLLYNNFSVTLISIYICLPFAIMPIFSALEKFDFSLLEASEDLGAKNWQSFFYIYIPGIRSGLISAFVFTFINTFGNYAVARLVGGQSSYVLGSLVVHNATVGRNMPLAAAISTVICLIALILMMFSQKSQKEKVS
ncbi:MAG: ABC transporter permease [Brevinema sp.]